MPEGPTIVVFSEEIKPFAGRKITESGGYGNPYAEELAGQELLSVSSYGKYLILHFKKYFITVHFGLFGSFLINERKKVNASFSLFFDHDELNFYVVKIKKIDGKDADYFDEERNPFSEHYNPKKIAELLAKKYASKKIGDALMDQQIFPGLGNIIRNEILFMSKIHPESVVGKLPRQQILKLLENFVLFSRNSPDLIRNKTWKTSAAVYQKKNCDGKPVLEYISTAIKRKTFVAESVQKLY